MAIPVWGGVSIGPTGQKLKKIIDSYPGDKSNFYVTSAYRPGDGGHHGGLSYGGSPTAAIDIGFSYPNNTDDSFALARWLYQFSGDIVELIHSNSRGGSFVKNQQRVGPYAAADHWNHVHFATSSALADRMLSKISSGGSSGSSGGNSNGASQAEISVTPWRERPGLDVGSSGGAVAHLQFLLRDRLGYNIDKFDHAPFGPQTAAAVKDFKQNYPLPNGDSFQTINSGVGKSTWEAIEIAAAQSISPKNRPEVSRGDSGMWVGYAQYCLRQADFDIDDINGFPFGPQTETAVRGFREMLKDLGYDYSIYDLINEGVWSALDSWQQGKPWAPKNEEPPPPAHPTVRRGDSGTDVCVAQAKLRSFGYQIDKFDHCPFGPQTEAAVVDFQNRNGLTPDGVVGPVTWAKLNDPKSKGPANSSPSVPNRPPNQGSGSAVTPGALLWLRDEITQKGSSHGLSGVRFAGIGPSRTTAYGYHNSRARHESGITTTGKGDYSIQLAPDREGDRNLYSAIDLSSEAATRTMTARLKAATDKNDPRMRYIREFYGSLDNRTVLGRIHNGETSSWNSGSADNSHLWHVHISFFRKYANDMNAVVAVADVLLGR